MEKQHNYYPMKGKHWVETLSDDEFIARELKRLNLSKHLKKPKHDLTFFGRNERLVLSYKSCKAILVWNKKLVSRRTSVVDCSLFINNSSVDSAKLLLEAMELARLCWLELPFNVQITSHIHPKKAEKIFHDCGWVSFNETATRSKIYKSSFQLNL